MTDRHSRKQAELKAKRIEEQAHAAMDAMADPIAGLKMKYLEARKLFERATEQYRLGGKWRNAGICANYAGDAQMKLGDPCAAGLFYGEAGDLCARKDQELAIEYYSKGISLMAREGVFQSAAVMQEKVSELYVDMGSFRDAAVAYSYAGELYMGYSDRSKCCLMLYQAGIIYADLKMWADASSAFMKAVTFASDDNIMQYKINSLLLDAGLVIFAAGDLPAMEEFVAKNSVEFPMFMASRERRFMLHMIKNAVTIDIEGFVDHLWNYDYVSKFKPHQLRLLKHTHEMFLAEEAEAKRRKRAAELAEDRRKEKSEYQERMLSALKGMGASEDAIKAAMKHYGTAYGDADASGPAPIPGEASNLLSTGKK